MLPALNQIQRNTQFTTNLMGLNLSEGALDAADSYSRLEWSWTQNTDTKLSPAVRRREKRILVGELAKPNGLCALNALAFVDGKKFYYNGYFYSKPVGDTTGNLEDSAKTMVPMGSDIVIFPDRKIFNTVNCSWREMDVKNVTGTTVTISLARPDGTLYTNYTTSSTAPTNPSHGDLWLDTSEYTAVMKNWSSYLNMWVDEYTTCVSVAATNIGKGLQVDDAVTVSGITGATDLNGTWVLRWRDDDHIVYDGVITAQATQEAAVTVKREAPAMDFVIEHNNRLWGCSSANHEIYACALGDPTNWRRYQGLSTDSYAVTVGSPGPFTGAAVVNSSVCFFKENCIHKIYGTMPSNFQMTVDHYRGVESGSGKSLVRVNELVYYKSVFDVCAYDGTEVAGCSSALGLGPWKNAVAGANDRRVYISMQDASNAWHLLTLDTETGNWMREDGTHALWFASHLTETFMLTADGKLWALRTGEYAKNAYMYGSEYVVRATEETDAQVEWLLRTPELLAKAGNNKRVGKIQILIELAQGATVTVKLKKDNEAWETVKTYTAGARRRYTLPIWPRRCDRLQIELSGTGEMKLINLGWLFERGSEYGREY